MKVIKKKIKLYKTSYGVMPFEEWLAVLKKEARLRVQSRLDRMRAGNLGDFKSLKGGVYEIRIFAYGGLRVYFGFGADAIILLLCGGDKRSQKQDIKLAKKYWQDYLSRRYKNVH